MNLKQLEAFVQVAEGGSFSKAAKELYLTQPTISAHISALEKELNARLFIRNTKEVSLSEDGKDLYRHAKQIIDIEKKIEERFGAKGPDARQCITIAASTIPAQYLLPVRHPPGQDLQRLPFRYRLRLGNRLPFRRLIHFRHHWPPLAGIRR